MTSDEPKPTDYVASWVAAHRSEIGGTQLRSAWREEYSRAYCAGFETAKYIIQLDAWDNACCLDILALNKMTEATDYMIAGECDGTTGLSARLDAFLCWLNANEPNRGA